MLRSLKSFLQDRAGNVMIMFAGMGVGLVLMVGAGVDYTRAVQFKSALQALADASVLAGASVYVSTDTATDATNEAQAYWTNGLSRLPPYLSVGTPNFWTTNDASGYSVHVTVPTSSIKTTFLSLATMNSIGVTVTATAKDPIVSAKICLNGWSSDAGDGNSIYSYNLPPKNGKPPAFNAANIANGTYTLLFSNMAASPPVDANGCMASFSIAAAQPVAFAFENQTAAHSPGWNYCNQYGGCTGTTHLFFSQFANPNGTSSSDLTSGSDGAGYPSGSSYNGGSVKNCSLQVRTFTDMAHPPTESNTFGATPGTSCLTPTATVPTYFAPSCSTLAGSGVHYSWNDMGGGVDDTDYNDGQYDFKCDTSGTPNNGVVLTD